METKQKLSGYNQLHIVCVCKAVNMCVCVCMHKGVVYPCLYSVSCVGLLQVNKNVWFAIIYSV